MNRNTSRVRINEVFGETECNILLGRNGSLMPPKPGSLGQPIPGHIGPGEIEEALLRHPAVRLAAAIGVPDPVRTESIKAFLMLADGKTPSEALRQEICEFVKTRLGRHECPRAIEFVDSLPTTRHGQDRAARVV